MPARTNYKLWPTIFLTVMGFLLVPFAVAVDLAAECELMIAELKRRDEEPK